MRIYSAAILDEYDIRETYPHTMGEHMLMVQYIMLCISQQRMSAHIHIATRNLLGHA
jgi:hypothetical protein